MIPFQHPDAHRILQAHPDDKDKVADLHVFDLIQDTTPFVASLWKPTPEELALLNEGQAVMVGIAGHTHPPIFVTVTAPATTANTVDIVDGGTNVH